MTELTDQMQRCIEECNACYAICLEALEICQKHKNCTPSHVGALRGCADICKSTAQMITSLSNFYSLSCGICAEVCRHTANECLNSGIDDSIIQRCAEICLRSALACERMLFSHQGGFSETEFPET